MEIIPALDLKGGKCVRLLQGRDESTIEYSDDPIAAAREWVRQGARRLHIVNLDGAFGRRSGHLDLLRRIAETVDVPLQFGGGLRSRDEIEQALAAGADRLVLGTAAVESPEFLRDAMGEFGPEKFIVAVDAVGGKVATRGWRDVTDLALLPFTRRLQDAGVHEVLYTDIRRDGMMAGPDLSTLRELAHIGVTVLASGGIASREDIHAILALREPRISGVIIGRALYEKKLELRTLLKEIGAHDHPLTRSAARRRRDESQ